ncbi:fibrous sheath CABYR-binding protein-like [Scomber scombrus]|nr:fibrous sheath CABYR-binding protein-like [Scomber scombrus]
MQLVEEVVTDLPEPEQVVEAVVCPPDEEDEAEVEVLAEEVTPEVAAEPVAITEVPDIVPEAPVEEVEAPVTEVKEDVADTLVDDFVVTESVAAVEIAIAESAAVEQETVAMSEPVIAETESVDVTPAEPEPQPEPTPAPAPPAEEMTIDATAEQKCVDVPSEEPKSEICDMPCQMQQLVVESVQLNSVEMAVETALNGHIVPEVSIEG